MCLCSSWARGKQPATHLKKLISLFDNSWHSKRLYRKRLRAAAARRCELMATCLQGHLNVDTILSLFFCMLYKSMFYFRLYFSAMVLILHSIYEYHTVMHDTFFFPQSLTHYNCACHLNIPKHDAIYQKTDTFPTITYIYIFNTYKILCAKLYSQIPS